MPDPIGSLARRAAAAACLSLIVASTALAQTRPLADVPGSPQFIPRLDLHLSAEALSIDDERFSWDTHWGGELDLVDYVSGRLSFLADYQAVLGNELQPFDPNQGNYTLAAAGTVRAGGTEFAGVFHHVSRHLGDRPKTFGIAWNAVLARVLREFRLGDATLDLRADAGKVINRAYVDYTWVGLADLTLRRSMSPRVGVYGRAYGEAFAVDEERAGRQGQRGGRIEAGVRLSGNRGALELFGGYERMVDADPLDRESRRWAFAGFRLVN